MTFAACGEKATSGQQAAAQFRLKNDLYNKKPPDLSGGFLYSKTKLPVLRSRRAAP
jgi:hypothetical protein